VCEQPPLTYAESGSAILRTATVINVTNGKLIRLFVDDEPFDVRYGPCIARACARLPSGHADPTAH
jgi:hypothetical protein